MSESNPAELVKANQDESGSEPRAARAVALKLSDSIGIFPDLVAAGTPTPGGGSVAALCGVMAASLGQMVCNITIGKPKYAANEPRLKEVRDELERLGARLRELIAEDADSFEAVLKAYRLPKDSEEQKQERAARIQAATLGSINVPLETAARSFEVLKYLQELAVIGNPNALSDAGVGARLAQTAIKGASYNVRINLGSLSDKEAAERLSSQMTLLVDESQAIAEEVEARI
ncbi:MAG TPA: cyclodeaminase/cyclohydrolase family protein [Blastocatellia bacterium]|nr:cyclodeaminase/cyclohydrolase family protein [Blastocatellia bacterium]